MYTAIMHMYVFIGTTYGRKHDFCGRCHGQFYERPGADCTMFVNVYILHPFRVCGLHSKPFPENVCLEPFD
jgi:hypothetical protein